MSKEMAKRHKKAARRERKAGHVKQARRTVTALEKKQAARAEQVVGGAGSQEKNFGPSVENQPDEAPAAYTEPIANTVEVMEIAVVAEPEDFLEADEAELSLIPMEGSLEDEQ
jgi:hypothetical protein